MVQRRMAAPSFTEKFLFSPRDFLQLSQAINTLDSRPRGVLCHSSSAGWSVLLGALLAAKGPNNSEG